MANEIVKPAPGLLAVPSSSTMSAMYFPPDRRCLDAARLRGSHTCTHMVSEWVGRMARALELNAAEGPCDTPAG